MAVSTVQRAPLCIVCGQAIIHQYNRFRCTEAEGSKLTKLGNTLEDVAKKADIQLKIAMGAVSHMCRHCREFVLRIDKNYQNVLSMQKKLQDLLKPRLASDDGKENFICPKSPDRDQQHSQRAKGTKSTGTNFESPPKNTIYVQSKRSLAPVHYHEPTRKKPMRLLLPKPTKRSLPSPQTRTGLSPASKRTTVIRSQASQPTRRTLALCNNKEQTPPASSLDPDSEPNARVSAKGLCPTVFPFNQEEVVVKVYEDIEDDEEEDVKVCLINV